MKPIHSYFNSQNLKLRNDHRPGIHTARKDGKDGEGEVESTLHFNFTSSNFLSRPKHNFNTSPNCPWKWKKKYRVQKLTAACRAINISFIELVAIQRNASKDRRSKVTQTPSQPQICVVISFIGSS